MNNSTFDMIISVSLGMVGLVGVGYAIGTKSKMNKICEKLDTSIDNLANDMNINIPDAMIDKAVKKAIKNKTEEAVDYAVSEVTKDFKNDIYTKVNAAVEAEYLNIKDKVLDEVTNRVAKNDEKSDWLDSPVDDVDIGKYRSSSITYNTCYRFAGMEIHETDRGHDTGSGQNGS